MDYSVFIANKYTKWYMNIIVQAQKRSKLPKCQTERHHILPRSIFPEFADLTRHPLNGVDLTYREHYICHWLLPKMVHPNCVYSMTMALARMTKGTERRYRPKSLIYSNTRKAMRQAISGKNSPFYGVPKTYPSGNKGVPMREETKEKIRVANIGKVASIETKARMGKSRTGKLNPKFKGYYHTPWGKFESAKAGIAEGVSLWMVKTWCNNPDVTISENHVSKTVFLSKNDIGRTFRMLGFYKTTA